MARRKKISHKAHKRKASKSRRHSRRGLRGLGAMTSPKAIHGALPALVATLVTAGVTIGIRIALSGDVATNATSAKASKYAPAIGAGAGLLSAGAFFALSGPSAATSAALVSLANAAILMATDKVFLDKPVILQSMAALNASSAPEAPAGTSGLYGYGIHGLGAIVPETNLGAILMERNRGGLIGMGATVPHAGEIVDLSGTINPAAFGQ